jgi:hypothetical protein
VKVQIVGQSNNKAKLLDWHSETFDFPPALLTDVGRAAVAAMTAQAELTGSRLQSIVGNVFQAIASPKADLGDRTEQGPILLAYWRSAERAFRNVLAEANEGIWSVEQIAGVFAIRLISAVNGAWEDGRAEFGQRGAALAAVAKHEGLVYELTRDLIPSPAPRVVPFAHRLLDQLAAADEADGATDASLTPAALAVSLGVTRRHITRIAARLDVGTRQGEGRRAVWSFSAADAAAIRQWFTEHGRRGGV